jgi:NitT/TauT family transport system ATP-binding protein
MAGADMASRSELTNEREERSFDSVPAPHITIRDLKKSFEGAVVYDQFSLNLSRGKVVSVFGPNGCGKSTLINMISGLLPYDDGEVLFGGKTIQNTRIGYVFQNYREALFPWLRAIDNIHYPLKIMGLDRKARAQRVEELLSKFSVPIDFARYPYELSGGQQQAISIMRALVVEPEVLFMDEPFSALDYEMTLFMRDQIQQVLMTTATTTVIVSHDLEEAVYLADEVMLLTRRPTKVAALVPVLIPRPRNMDTLSSPEFVRTKAKCLDIFRREAKL